MAEPNFQPFLDDIARAASDRTDPRASFERILIQTLVFCGDFLAYQLVNQIGLVVQSGPFQGMQYIRTSAGSSLIPKLLGCYEAELHAVIAEFPCRKYRRVINVGCGEGYYAVGLARLLPDVSVFAFDSDPAAEQNCRALIATNGAGHRVITGGTCGPTELAMLITPDTLLFCDIEGGERELLDPTVTPALKQCDILVELHDFLDGTLSTLVPQRFGETHDVQLIHPAGRNPYAYPALANSGWLEQFLATTECRPGPTPWAFMTVRRPR